MENLKHILVGVDYSPSSSAALKEAWRIAQWNKALFSVLHILEKEAIEDLKKRVSLEEDVIVKEAGERLRAHLAEVLGEEAASESDINVVVGHPFMSLLETVESTAPDLLVLGSRGSSPREAKTGALASKAVRKLPVRVLLVRMHHDGPFKKVVACVDFSANSNLAVEQAVRIAQQDRSELHLVHVFKPVAPGLVDVAALAQPMNPLTDEKYIPHLEENMLGLLGPYQDEIAGLTVEAHVIEELSIGHGIIDGLKEIGADLVVLGTRGRTGLKLVLMGTTAERVIHDAPCSTLAIKPKGFSFRTG